MCFPVRRNRLFFLVVFLAWLDAVQGVKLSGCNGITDVPSGARVALTCLDTAPTVTWYITASIAATCDKSTCSVRQAYTHSSALLATRPNVSSTVLHVHMEPFRDTLPRMECLVGAEDSVSCFLRSVYTEAPKSCRFDVITGTSTVSGSCEIAKIYASDEKYLCRWREAFQDQTDRTLRGNLSGLTSYTDSGRSYARGVCSFSSAFFAVQGVFRYSLHMDPGSPVFVASLVIDGYGSMKVSAPSFVKATVDGTPGSVETTTATTTTSAYGTRPTTAGVPTSERPRSSEGTTSRRTSRASDPTTSLSSTRGTSTTATDISPLVIGAVAGGLGLVIIVVLNAAFCVFLLRRKSRAKKECLVESAVGPAVRSLPPLPPAACGGFAAAAGTSTESKRGRRATTDTLPSFSSHYTELTPVNSLPDDGLAAPSLTQPKEVYGTYDRPGDITESREYQMINDYISITSDYLTPVFDKSEDQTGSKSC